MWRSEKREKNRGGGGRESFISRLDLLLLDGNLVFLLLNSFPFHNLEKSRGHCLSWRERCKQQRTSKTNEQRGGDEERERKEKQKSLIFFFHFFALALLAPQAKETTPRLLPMRFAKRFRASFTGDFSHACLDYKALKKLSKKLNGGEESESETSKRILHGYWVPCSFDAFALAIPQSLFLTVPSLSLSRSLPSPIHPLDSSRRVRRAPAVGAGESRPVLRRPRGRNRGT